MKPCSEGRPDRADHDPRRGRWYPWLFVAAFLVVIAVNGVMVTLAVESFAGLETEHPYERGLAYNETLAAKRAQDALGWTVAFDAVPADMTEGMVRVVEVTGAFQDRAGAPLTGLDVRAVLRRPAAAGHDQEIALAPRGPGRYSATAELPFPGQWELLIVANGVHRGSVQSWQSTRRILLP